MSSRSIPDACPECGATTHETAALGPVTWRTCPQCGRIEGTGPDLPAPRPEPLRVLRAYYGGTYNEVAR